MTTLADLQKLGAFVTGAPVKKTIEFSIDGGEKVSATVFVKRMSIGEQERIFMRTADSDDESRTARMICELVTLGDGTEKLEFAQAFSLDPVLGKAMIEAIGEVNKQLTEKK